MLNESGDALYGLHKTAQQKPGVLGSNTKGKINVTHSALKNDADAKRDSFDEDEEYYNDEDEDEGLSEEEKGSQNDRGAQKIKEKRIRGQKKKFNRSKVFNRVVRGNVLDQAAILESDSSPAPDNFDPVESRPDVMSISDNIHGLSM
jgi:hypothetical protein